MSLSRRDFLKTSGALIVTFSLAPKSTLAQRLDGASSNQVDGWLSINADGTITAFTGKCELGHGLYTAQTQLVAEELSAPFNRVKLIQCDTALTPDQGTTSGAQSHPTNFNQAALALAFAEQNYGISRKDIMGIVERLAPGKAAALLLIEHQWAIRLKAAVRAADGRMLAHSLVTPEALLWVGDQVQASADAEAAIELTSALEGSVLLEILAEAATSAL